MFDNNDLCCGRNDDPFQSCRAGAALTFFLRDKDAAFLFCLVPAHRVLVCELLHSAFLFTYEPERHAVGAWVGRMKVRNSSSEYFFFLFERKTRRQLKS